MKKTLLIISLIVLSQQSFLSLVFSTPSKDEAPLAPPNFIQIMQGLADSLNLTNEKLKQCFDFDETKVVRAVTLFATEMERAIVDNINFVAFLRELGRVMVKHDNILEWMKDCLYGSSEAASELWRKSREDVVDGSFIATRLIREYTLQRLYKRNLNILRNRQEYYKIGQYLAKAVERVMKETDFYVWPETEVTDGDES